MTTDLTPGAAQAAQAELDREAGLARRLTSSQIAMIGLSGALGTGLFLGSGSMIAQAGPAIVVSYALTGLLALVVVFAMAEVTTAHPVHGGFGASSAAYVGPFLGYLARWNVAITMALAVGVEVVAAATYLAYWWPTMPLWVGVAVFSAVVIAINMAVVALYGASEYWFSLLKVVVVVAFIALGLVLILFGLPGRPAEGLQHLTAHGGFAPHGVAGILLAAVGALFSFGGAESVSIAAAESADPVRDVPRAAKTMIARLVIFYVGAIFIVVTVIPWTVTAASSGDVKDSPFVSVLAATGLPGVADFMNLTLVIAALSSANGCLYGSTRMVHSLAVDQMAPRALAVTSAKGTPRRAAAVSCAGMVLACVLAIVLPSKVFGYFFGILIMGPALTWVYVLLTHLGFVTKRRRLGLAPSPFRLPGGRVTSAVALAVMLAVIVALAFIGDYAIAWQVGAPVTVLVALGYLLVPRAVRQHNREHHVLTEELQASGR